MSHDDLMEMIRDRLGEKAIEYVLPPPCFVDMRGEFVGFDAEAASLTVRFPVSQGQRNPYGSMQGGMIAAAVDNTVGPLSMLVAPPNFTRRMELKYSRPISADVESIVVKAQLVLRKGRQLTFSAEVQDHTGGLFASARAVHWIVDRYPEGAETSV